ncbi:ferritin-like domain-containing protein [Gymnopilus junonius]|uniref:Ferritin-like domain-containing protein n=1 Tax=Gymnopilus junonius TaxID=109634 RepID=A0A9P5TMB9_GYMJU|nr:ferritin-like domain-containing protein [Gymnopilus junonius]
MHFTSLVALVALVPFVSAAPTRYGKRTVAASDILVYKFADVLEQLEATFYSQALSKFQAEDFTTAGFSSSQLAIEQITSIQQDEATHSSVLQAAITSFGEQPITSCKFNFDSSLTDVTTMAQVARVVENVGVGAYLGGATLITDPVLLDSAGSILTVEARHQTILNILSSSGTAIPDAFDTPLTPSEVLALTAPFFDGPCDVGIPANPTLSVTNTGSIGPGTQLSFSSPAITSANDTANFFCQMMLGGQPFSIPLPYSQCVVPQGINGPVAIFITSDGQPLINNVRDRATTQLVAGPTMAFIDTQPQMLGQLARTNGNGQVSSVSTATISPAQASAIISAAGSSTVDASVATATATADASSSSSGTNLSSPGSSSTAGTDASQTPGGPNNFTGQSADGSITVDGWTNVTSS